MSTQFKILVGILFTFATLVVLVILGVNEENRMTRVAATFQGRNIEQGASIYETYCVTCHGRHGEGLPGFGPPLNRKDLLDTTKAPYLRAIRFGGTSMISCMIPLRVDAHSPARSTPASTF